MSDTTSNQAKNIYHLKNSKTATLNYWLQHPFYTDEKLVTLGLDIGLQGIGICIRRGNKIIYDKSLVYDVPEVNALKGRRLYRSARHARKNRKTRMSRLKQLFTKHNLPWITGNAFKQSNPFLLRHRAVNGTGLKSKEALAVCIRHVVKHRGYDYQAMSFANEELPWGDSTKLTDAKKWLQSAFLDEHLRDWLQGDALSVLESGKTTLDELTKDGTRSEACDEWVEAVNARYKESLKRNIPELLAEYASKVKVSSERQPARGNNFPRIQLENHLRTIIEKHHDLLENSDEFLKTLFSPCKNKEQKQKAIFHYNRKTPEEARKLFDKKIKSCSYCNYLDLPHTKCATRGESSIRAWNMLDFLTNRTFEIITGKGQPERRTLPESAIRSLYESIMDTSTLNNWASIKQKMIGALKQSNRKFVASSIWNKQQIEQLKDICKPSASASKGRASLSDQAALELIKRVTLSGGCFDPSRMEERRKEMDLYAMRQASLKQAALYPQVKMLLGNGKSMGFLQSLFLNLKDELGGKTYPDYFIIEQIRDMPRNKKQKDEITKDQKNRKELIDKLSREYGVKENQKITPNMRLRMKLHHQQGGSPKHDAICPFTGVNLGTDPFSPNLALAHLFPDSAGGLATEDNLVLTTTRVNDEMGNRTPKQAAHANIPGWNNWAKMIELSGKFKWTKTKRDRFNFEATDECLLPDQGMHTFTSQIARQLRDKARQWMQLSTDEEVRTRIGNPSGGQTAAARRSWIDSPKDRSTHTHHRIDAAILAFIPPAEGLNSFVYKGIFETFMKEVLTEGAKTYLPTLRALPELKPDLSSLDDEDTECPIVRIKSGNKWKTLGDSTFWKVLSNGRTRQRTGFDPKNLKPDEILKNLQAMNIPEDWIPSLQEIKLWLEKNDTEQSYLRLKNGNPIKSIHKFDSKGTFINPMGWSGIISSSGKVDQLRNLDGVNDCMEIWLGWHEDKKPSKSGWQFFKRIVPSKKSMQGLKRLGIPWRGRKNATPQLIEMLDKNKKKDLRDFYLGTLPPFSKKIATIHKEDLCKAVFKLSDKDISKGASPIPSEPTWGHVAAINSDQRLQINSLIYKNAVNIGIKDVSKILKNICNIETSPNELAKQLNMTIPTASKKGTVQEEEPFKLE